jgi:hypothetical protein
MACRMDTFGPTDIGRMREQSEDQFLIADLEKSDIIHQTSCRKSLLPTEAVRRQKHDFMRSQSPFNWKGAADIQSINAGSS